MFNVMNNRKVVLKGMERLNINAEKTLPLMRYIAGDMKTKVDFRFRLSKDPNGKTWKSLSETTISHRRKRSSKPLSDTGELRASITNKATKTLATVGTNKKYATTQNFGANKGEFGTTQIKETVREHTRRRRGRTETVRTHTRNRNINSPWGDIPAREFIGFSWNQKKTYTAVIRKYLRTGKF